MVLFRTAGLLAFLVAAPSHVWAQGGPPPGEGGPASSSSTSTSVTTEECDTSGADADYSEALIETGDTIVRQVTSSTACPNHVNWAINPNPSRMVGANVTIPAYPNLFADGGTTDLSEAPLGTGIMLNGVHLFSSWAVGTVVDYETTAFAAEGDTFDLCGGHATVEGIYHYHNVAGCLQEQAMAAAGTTDAEHSPQIGWSYDGFPVYGQLGPDGVEMLLCGNDGADSSYCLDSCSGYEGELSDVDEFLYRYYLSCGFDEAYFPFTTNCYRGCCPDGVSCDSKVEDCGDSPEEGYTSAYVPTEGTDLSAAYDAELIEGDDSEFVGSDSSLDCSLYLGSATASFETDDSGSSSVSPSSGLIACFTALTLAWSVRLLGF